MSYTVSEIKVQIVVTGVVSFQNAFVFKGSISVGMYLSFGVTVGYRI